jgi:hypothetical protein
MKVQITKTLTDQEINQIYIIWNSVYPAQVTFANSDEFIVHLLKKRH